MRHRRDSAPGRSWSRRHTERCMWRQHHSAARSRSRCGSRARTRHPRDSAGDMCQCRRRSGSTCFRRGNRACMSQPRCSRSRSCWRLRTCTCSSARQRTPASRRKRRRCRSTLARTQPLLPAASRCTPTVHTSSESRASTGRHSRSTTPPYPRCCRRGDSVRRISRPWARIAYLNHDPHPSWCRWPRRPRRDRHRPRPRRGGRRRLARQHREPRPSPSRLPRRWRRPPQWSRSRSGRSPPPATSVPPLRSPDEPSPCPSIAGTGNAAMIDGEHNPALDRSLTYPYLHTVGASG